MTTSPQDYKLSFDSDPNSAIDVWIRKTNDTKTIIEFLFKILTDSTYRIVAIDR